MIKVTAEEQRSREVKQLKGFGLAGELQGERQQRGSSL